MFKEGSTILLPIFLILISGILGCGNRTTAYTYEQITAKEAKEIMEKETGYLILDVRTEEEYVTGHIENAILIPDYEIEARAEAELTDKEQMILVYCRSGRRSKGVAEKLAEMGYCNVKEFGGIIDWSYGVVTE